MKHLKKLTAVLLAVLLTTSPFVGVPFASVFAAESITVTTAVEDGETIAQGEEVTFTVSLSAPFSAKSLALDFQGAYDHSLFSWVSGKWSDEIEFSAVTDVNEEDEVAAFLNQSAVTVEGEIFSFVLRVKDTVSCGATDTVKVIPGGIDGAVAEGIFVTVGHKYSNICDPECDACGDVRVPEEHDYENACDSECGICGATRSAPHVFSNDGDEVCNECGAVRTVAYTLTTSASASSLNAGDSITVTVTLDKVRQTKSFALDFLTAYDHGAFEWVSGDWTQEVKELVSLTDVNAGSEAIFLATSEAEIPAGVIFSFVLCVKDSASCLKPYEIKAGASGIPNVSAVGDEISLIHKYTSDCDPRCDVCEMSRTPLAEHSYDNACDTSCNVCGATRLVSHDYEYSCSTVCKVCGATRVTVHTYTDDWDDICNVCAEVRPLDRTLSTKLVSKTASAGELVTVEIYLDNPITLAAAGLDFESAYDHDAFEWVDGYFSGAISFAAYTQVNDGVDAVFLATEEFTIQGLVFTMVLRVKDTASCGEAFEIKAYESGFRGAALAADTLTLLHAYDNACDADCNVCGDVRVPEEHRYDNACDTDCNVCGEVRTVEHSFDNEGDEDCNVCGETRIVERELITSVSVSEAKLGDEITVTVSLSKPKVTAMMGLDFENAYDRDAFEWVSGSWSAAVQAGADLVDVQAGEAAVFLASDPIEVGGEIFRFTLRVKTGDLCGETFEIKASCTQIENLTSVGAALVLTHGYQWESDGDSHWKSCVGCGEIDEATRGNHVFGHDGDEACDACGALRLAFYGTSLTLQHNFAINYKVKPVLLEKYTDLSVEVTMNGETTELRAYTVDKSGYLSFQFEDIAPQTIGDEIVAVLRAKENGVDTQTKPYTSGVKAYCDKALEYYADEAYATFRTLIVDLLHYGAKAQVYTDYKPTELVDRELTDTQLSWGTQGEPALTNHFVYELKTIENPTATWYGAGLILDSAVTLKLKFKVESIEGVKVQIVIEDGKTVVIDDAKHFRHNAVDGLYHLSVNGLNADQMSKKLELTILDAEGNAISNTAQYSIESYAFEKQNSTVPGLASLVKAMMNYGNAAVAYSKQ